MGKNKANSKNKHNNVFKVAGARSLKVKKKAKAVTSQLKKLAEVTRQKTAQADKELAELQSEVRQGAKKIEEKETKMTVQQEHKREIVEPVNPLEAMNRMCQLQM
ncbi:ribosomal biogenesis factor isoform X2 [Anabrus simplex]|uniref:ribosomal biogenesis factor isoform X2 n=1 Tax=Anabrus simplex TaxID=316456 RepID=UPI0035A30C33